MEAPESYFIKSPFSDAFNWKLKGITTIQEWKRFCMVVFFMSRNAQMLLGIFVHIMFGIDCFPIEITEDAIALPWFSTMLEPDEVNAHTRS